MEKVIFKSINFASEYKIDKVTIYYFWCETEDGRKGQFSTKKRDQTKFEIGKEYDVTVEKKVSKGGNEYFFFDTVKDNEQFKDRKGKFTPHYEKPEVQARITAATALELAIQSAKLLKKDKGVYEQMRIAYLNWILKEGEEPQTQLSRRTALELAVKAMEIESEGIDNGTKIFEYADKFYSLIK